LACIVGAKYRQGADDCEAGYRDPLAPRRSQTVLALQIAARRRPTGCTVGNSSADPRDEHRQPLWGAPRSMELLRLGIDIGRISVAK